MDLGLRVSDIVFPMFAFLFPFWPLIVLAPAFSRGNALAKMLVIWVVMLGVRIVLVYSPLPTVDFLIHEPANTVVFLFASGAIVLGFLVGRLRQLA